MPAKIPADKLIKDLQRVAQDLGRAPRMVEYAHFGKYNPITLSNKFEGWQNCLIAAGIEPVAYTKPNKWTDEDLQNELDRLTKLLGHPPAFSEIKKFSKISPTTFEIRLGSCNFVDVDPSTPKLSSDWSIDKVLPEDGAWIAGFVAGEGCFIVSKTGGISFGISLRADDADVLESIRQIMGLPFPISVYSNASRRAQGQRAGDEVRLYCRNRQVCRARIIPFFDRFPIRSKKQLDFLIFKEAVLFLCQRDDNGRYKKRFTNDEKEYITNLANKLQALRFDPTKAIV
jgi:hypothetical protein